jgi:hypothetical protein
VLTCGCMAETRWVPDSDQICMTWRDQSLHGWISRLQGRIAPAMVTVQVGIEQQIGHLAIKSCLHQSQRL